MARRGNGVGIGGSAKGPGWGGPANGSGSSKSQMREEFTEGNQVAAGPHDMSRAERLKACNDKIFNLAMSGESETTQLNASIAFLNREEGMPIARSQVDATVGGHMMISDSPPTPEQWSAIYGAGLGAATGAAESSD